MLATGRSNAEIAETVKTYVSRATGSRPSCRPMHRLGAARRLTGGSRPDHPAVA
ncbi:hypothetical protein L083_2821 [Actinoplanes sp. N902-109]|nr:hypothetical protein L083_2821 [Actinoplanes sp. N902-109]